MFSTGPAHCPKKMAKSSHLPRIIGRESLALGIF